MYVLHPERRGELSLLQDAFGLGEHGEVYFDRGGLLFLWYRPL